MEIMYFKSGGQVKKFLFYLIAGILTGCVPSLHKLYTDRDLVFEKELLGAWTNDESWWVFEKGTDPNSYRLTIQDEKGQGRFVAHLVRIDDKLFLDLFPEPPKLKGSNDFYKMHLLAVHSFAKIEQIRPILKIRLMDPQKTEEMLKDNPKLLKHEVVDGRVVLTGSTEQLQRFFKNGQNIEKVFGQAGELKRVEEQHHKRGSGPKGEDKEGR